MKRKTSPIVDWRKYLDGTHPIITKYISKYGKDFIVQTLDKIKSAHTTNKSRIVLIRFRETNIISVLERKDYVHALQLLLNMCIKIEYYEVCTEIQNTIAAIKFNKKIKTNVRKEVTYHTFF